MANFDLNALLAEESATRPPLMLRPQTAGNPVMEQAARGFQITPEELAFKAQGDPDKARRAGLFQFLAGGPMRGMAARRESMEQSKEEQIQAQLRGTQNRLMTKENITAADMNRMAFYRASLTGEQPRTFRPASPTISRRTIHTRNDSGVMMSQDQRVRSDPNTGEVLDVKDIGDSYRKNALRRRAPLTSKELSEYDNVMDRRAEISAGGWDDRILDIIKAIDPDRSIDVSDPDAGWKALLGGKASDKVPNFILDYLNELTGAYDSVAGDTVYGDKSQRRKAKLALSERVFDIWKQHKYGDPKQEAPTGEPIWGRVTPEQFEMEQRLKSLGAPAAATTQDPSLFERARMAMAGDPYARQRAPIGPPTNVLRSAQAPSRLQPITTPRDPNVPGYRPEQFAGPGVSGIVPPMTTRSAPPAQGASTGYAGLMPMTPGQQPWESPSAMDRLQGGLGEIATTLNEWQGPDRANAALQRELEGPRPTDFNLSGLYTPQAKVPWQQRMRNVSEGRPSGIQSPMQMLDEALDAVADDLATRGPEGANAAYRRAVKKFKRGDREPRELSALERSLAEIVNGESAVR